MEGGPDRSARWIKTFILYVIAVSGVAAPFSFAKCVDGTYEHDGRKCCLCYAGQYLVDHCTQNETRGKCEFCPEETYISEPTSRKTCEPCTSCSHPNANLEEEEPCTPARNRKCRCQQDHYCSSRTEICILCQPCTVCDSAGIKVPCTANNDTVCNDKTTDAAGIIAAVVSVVVLSIISIVGVFLCKRKKKKTQQPMTNGNDETMQQLMEVDLQPHLPGIADIIGWIDMKDVAMSNNISSVTIETVQLDNPNNSREQTLQLLTHFNEKHSRKAAQMLIEALKRKGKNQKADHVQRLLSSPARVAESEGTF